VGYGASEGGLNQAVSHLGRRILSDEYAEPFRRTIAEAGLVVTMNSYNEVDGIPAAADRWLLTELLRDGLGFRGLVVSDYDSINMLRTVYHTATTEQEAGAQALEAGLDVELPSDPNFAHLADAVRAWG
jgi:beta-glucosidase